MFPGQELFHSGECILLCWCTYTIWFRV